MARPIRIRYGGAKYHVTSRGNARETIFHGEDDYQRFVEQLDTAVEKDEVVLYAYVLMPNHFHLYLETPMGNLSKFMQRLNTAYSMYHRCKHARPGHCMQGRYWAKVVGGDDYIIRLTRYIHLNPLRTVGMRNKSMEERKKYLDRFRWSSYRGYIRRNARESFIDYRWLELMGRRTGTGRMSAYRAYVEGMIGKKDELLDEALNASRYAIGDNDFIDQAESDLRDMRPSRAVFSDLVFPQGPLVPLMRVDEVVANEFAVTQEALHGHGRKAGIAKMVAVELCCVMSGKSQRDVARHYGYRTDAGVTRQRRMVAERMRQDGSLVKRIETLKRMVLK